MISSTLATALSLLMGAGPASDASADTVAVVEAVVRERLAFRGQSSSTAYLVLVAETVQLCNADSNPEIPVEYTLGELIRTAELDPATTAEMRRNLVCDDADAAEPMLPSARYEGADLVLSGWLRDAIPDIPDPEEWWAAFEARFPGSDGVMRVTMPVFSKDRNHALIWVLDGGPGMCGTDRVVALARRDGHWRIVAEKLLGIS